MRIEAEKRDTQGRYFLFHFIYWPQALAKVLEGGLKKVDKPKTWLLVKNPQFMSYLYET